MKRKIAVQLYSLREQAAKDFIGVLKKVADIGYKAVEPAGFHNLTPAEFKKVIDDLGLEMYSSHTPWCNGTNVSESIDMAGVLGLKNVVCGFGPDDFKDLDAIRRTADTVNAMQQKLEAAGLTLFQHNHNWEFEKLDGRLKYEIYAELCPKVKFQIDAFWSTNFGANDPAEMVRRFADRMILIHIKDGLLKQEEQELRMVNGTYDRKVELRPLGEGQMDIPAVLAATPDWIDNLVVELDYCSIDMTEAIERSYRYLVDSGLGYGNK